MGPAAAVAAFLALGMACGPDEPARPTPARPAEDGAEAAIGGVIVDVAALGGRRYDDVAERLRSQAGSLSSRRTLDQPGSEELTFQRAVVRLSDGVVVMIRVPLPAPVRPGDALRAVGLDGSNDGWIALSGELRLNNALGQRRIRLRRAAPRSERVVEVECWKRVPNER